MGVGRPGSTVHPRKAPSAWWSGGSSLGHCGQVTLGSSFLGSQLFRSGCGFGLWREGRAPASHSCWVLAPPAPRRTPPSHQHSPSSQGSCLYWVWNRDGQRVGGWRGERAQPDALALALPLPTLESRALDSSGKQGLSPDAAEFTCRLPGITLTLRFCHKYAFFHYKNNVNHIVPNIVNREQNKLLNVICLPLNVISILAYFLSGLCFLLKS